MFKKTIMVAGLALVAAASSPVLAGDDTVVGALLGAGVGAVIGHGVGGDRGAVIGGAVGAVAGASIANAEGRYERTHYEAPRAYYPPPPPRRYYDETPVFERRDPVVVEQITYPPRWHRHRSWHERHNREDRCDHDRDYRRDRYREYDGYDRGYNWR